MNRRKPGQRRRKENYRVISRRDKELFERYVKMNAET